MAVPEGRAEAAPGSAAGVDCVSAAPTPPPRKASAAAKANAARRPDWLAMGPIVAVPQ
jgi:hypothetical protein